MRRSRTLSVCDGDAVLMGRRLSVSAGLRIVGAPVRRGLFVRLRGTLNRSRLAAFLGSSRFLCRHLLDFRYCLVFILHHLML